LNNGVYLIGACSPNSLQEELLSNPVDGF